ncbi:MAG: benzoate-CoA ligase family protein [Chloroflexota bacterium]|nr:benzoate-CoA ligase family protein [Chloroflexota bacterium]
MPEVEVPEWFNAASYFVDRNLAEGRSDHVAILYQNQELTYRQVAENANRAGHALRELGLQMEQRVMLLLLDCPQLVYCFFGAMKIGAVPVPVNTLLKALDYRYLLNDSRARALVVSQELYATVEPILAELDYLPQVVVVGQVEGRPSFDDLIGGQPGELDATRTHKDDVAFWLYTSGTTGLSRAAVHLHHDMVHCFELYARGILDIGESDRTYSVAKLFFAYGLGNALYCPFGVGATTILFPGRPQPDVVFEVVNRYRPTLFFAVPTAYAGMLHAAERGAPIDMSSVRLAVSAGESLPASIYQRWLERFGVEILDGIGSTEILHIFVSNRPGQVRPGSTGKVVPGYQAKLVDDDGQPVPTGEAGNLTVRGDSICAYYWNQHDATRRAIQGEWMRTGDKYHLDQDGYFWYDGRADDMLKVGGIWVSPAEVENVIVEHPSVLECAVIGAEDADRLVKPMAFVVLKDGTNAGDELTGEIQSFVKGRIAPYKYPRWIEFVEELPKTATGKIQRFKLREDAGQTA